jgi:hypothetical protein
VPAVSVVVMVVDMLLLSFLDLFARFVHDFYVIIQNGGDDWDHVCLNDSGANIFGATNTNVHNALESKIPLPHAHHILAPPLFENANKSFDASIDSEDITDASRGCG